MFKLVNGEEPDSSPDSLSVQNVTWNLMIWHLKMLKIRTLTLSALSSKLSNNNLHEPALVFYTHSQLFLVYLSPLFMLTFLYEMIYKALL